MTDINDKLDVTPTQADLEVSIDICRKLCPDTPEGFARVDVTKAIAEYRQFTNADLIAENERLREVLQQGERIMDDAAICEESKSNLKTFFNTMLENSVSYLITDEQKKIFLEHCSEGVCASIDGISDATTKIKDELSVRYSLVGQVIMMEALALHIERQVAVIEDMAMT